MYLLISLSLSPSIGRLIRHQGLPCYWPPPQAPPTATPTQGKGVGHVAGTEELEERLDALVEANDILLERVVSTSLLLYSMYMYMYNVMCMVRTCNIACTCCNNVVILVCDLYILSVVGGAY